MSFASVLFIIHRLGYHFYCNCYRFADSAEANDACGLAGAGWVAWCHGNDKVVRRGEASANVRSGGEKQHMQTWSRSGSWPGKPDRRTVDMKASRWRRIGSNVGLEISWSRWIGQANGMEASMWCRIQRKMRWRAPGGIGSTKIRFRRVPANVGLTKLVLWASPGGAGSTKRMVWRASGDVGSTKVMFWRSPGAAE